MTAISRFRLKQAAWLAAIVSLGSILPASTNAANSINELTPSEKKEGWSLLFDGQSTDAWRGFGKEDFPQQGWVVEDGWLKHLNDAGGGDIITKRQFADFELKFEWRAAKGANSGVKYFIKEDRGKIGHEYQLLDDASSHSGRPEGQTAAFYDVFPSKGIDLKPAGQVNSSRILVQGDHVEHWLNGEKVLAYTLGSPKTLQAVKDSKFDDVAGFGTKDKGHILLQDHGDAVWFRNIKIRAQEAP